LAEFFESSDMVTDPLFGIEFIKVINAEILIRLFVAEDKIDGKEQAVLHGADSALFPTSARR
jgi:hypothetical protein